MSKTSCALVRIRIQLLIGSVWYILTTSAVYVLGKRMHPSTDLLALLHTPPPSL